MCFACKYRLGTAARETDARGGALTGSSELVFWQEAMRTQINFEFGRIRFLDVQKEFLLIPLLRLCLDPPFSLSDQILFELERLDAERERERE